MTAWSWPVFFGFKHISVTQVINDFLTISTFSASQLFLGHIKSARVRVYGGGGTLGHLRLPDNSVNFYSLEPGGVNLEARQPSLKNANTSFEWLMQSGELGAFVYSFILTWQSKKVRCTTLRVEGNFCGHSILGVCDFLSHCSHTLVSCERVCECVLTIYLLTNRNNAMALTFIGQKIRTIQCHTHRDTPSLCMLNFEGSTQENIGKTQTALKYCLVFSVIALTKLFIF